MGKISDEELLKAIPPIKDAILQAIVAATLSKYSAQSIYLGDYSRSGLTSPRFLEKVSDFQKELSKLESDFKNWSWLCPSKVPSSIAI